MKIRSPFCRSRYNSLHTDASSQASPCKRQASKSLWSKLSSLSLLTCRKPNTNDFRQPALKRSIDEVDASLPSQTITADTSRSEETPGKIALAALEAVKNAKINSNAFKKIPIFSILSMVEGHDIIKKIAEERHTQISEDASILEKFLEDETSGQLPNEIKELIKDALATLRSNNPAINKIVAYDTLLETIAAKQPLNEANGNASKSNASKSTASSQSSDTSEEVNPQVVPGKLGIQPLDLTRHYDNIILQESSSEESTYSSESDDNSSVVSALTLHSAFDNEADSFCDDKEFLKNLTDEFNSDNLSSSTLSSELGSI